jgi:hypothetical protein
MANIGIVSGSGPRRSTDPTVRIRATTSLAVRYGHGQRIRASVDKRRFGERTGCVQQWIDERKGSASS